MSRNILPFLSLLLLSLTLTLQSAPVKIILRNESSISWEGTRIVLNPPAFSEVATEQRVATESIAVDTEGKATIPDTVNEQALSSVEVVGPNTRRARFDIPPHALLEGARPLLFRLKKGRAVELTLVDSESKEILGNGEFGPIIPGIDAAYNELDAVYPFFTFAKDPGPINIEGLLPTTNYNIPIYIPGYQRLVYTTRDGVEKERISLKAGGAQVAGKLLGHRTGKSYPKTLMNVQQVSGDLYLQFRSNEAGEYLIDGLPKGRYRLTSFLPEEGEGMETFVDLDEDQEMKGFVVPVPEGIKISGTITEQGSGLAISDVLVEARKNVGHSDSLGRFEIEGVRGPWPVYLEMSKDGFLPVQSDGEWEVNGLSMEDQTDLSLFMRKRRFLEFAIDGELPELEPTTHIIYDRQPRNRSNISRIFINPSNPVAEVEAPALLTYMSVVDNLITPLHEVSWSVEETTKTVSTTFDLPAIIGVKLTDDNNEPVNFDAVLTTDHPEESQRIPWYYTSTSWEGELVLAPLPTGSFYLVLTHSELKYKLFEIPVTLEPGKRIDIEEVVPRGLTFAGRVVTKEGAPISDIAFRVYTTDVAGAQINRLIISKRDGTFSLDGLGEGTIEKLMTENVQYKEYTDSDIPLPTDDYEMVLSLRDGITVNLDGSEVSRQNTNVHLLLGSKRSEGVAQDQWFYDVNATERAGGRATLVIAARAMAKGPYRAAAFDGTSWDISERLYIDEGKGNPEVTLNPGRTGGLRVTLKNMERDDFESCLITLENTSIPAGNQLEAPSPAFDNNGLVFKNLVPGEYYLAVTAPWGETQTINNLDIKYGQASNQTISFDGGLPTIAGIVSSDDGSPIKGASVIIYPLGIPEPDELGNMTTTKDGEFLFEMLPNHSGYLLIVDHDGQVRQKQILPPQFESLIQVRIPTVYQVTFQINQGGGQLPFMVEHLAGVMRGVYTFDQMTGGPIPLAAGYYRISRGEEFLGNFVVDADEKPQTISIPDGLTQP